MESDSAISDGPALPPGALVRLGDTSLWHLGVNRIAFSPEGRFLATAGKGCTARLWDVASRREVWRSVSKCSEHDRIWSLSFRPDGKLCVVLDGRVQVRCVRTGSLLHSINLRVSGEIVSSSNGEVYAAHEGTGQVIIYSAEGKAEARFRHGCGCLGRLSLSPDGRFLAVWERDAGEVWDTRAGRQLGRFSAPDGEKINSCAVAADGTVALGCDTTGLVILYQGTRGRELRRIKAMEADPSAKPIPVKNIESLCFSPDSRILFTTGYVSHLWRVSDGRRLTPPAGLSDAHLCAFSSGGLLALCRLNQILLLERRDGESYRLLTPLRRYVQDVRAVPERRAYCV